jgi:hypothetical protein
MLIVILSLFNSQSHLTAQCSVDPSCLIYPSSQYVCLQPTPPSTTMYLSDFIAPNGPLPQGGGFVNIIVEGNLIVDVDYLFDLSSHILSVYSLYGDGVVGKQTYRHNLWNGGTAAEAEMGAFFGPVLPDYYEMSQFIVQQNTGSLWPNPILPPQSPSGSQSEWFWHDPAPIIPEVCPEILEDPPVEELTSFEQGLIDGSIETIEGAEGKYRDHEFSIYYKFRKNPALLTPANEGYYESLHTPSFQKRYEVVLGLEELADLTAALPSGELVESLREQLEWLAAHDDGANVPLRDSMLAEVNATQSSLEAILSPYRTTLSAKADAVKSSVQSWAAEEPADSILQAVLSIYFDYFGSDFEGYTQADQDIIRGYATLCAVEYGQGVYLANAIAGSLQDYELLSSCQPPAHALVSGTEEALLDKLVVYPSPSTGMVNIQAQDEPIRLLRVINSLGETIQQWEALPGNRHELNLSGALPGIYFIEIIYGNGQRQIGKVALSR